MGAFTITTLSWGVVEFRGQLAASGELQNALNAVRWGTDYLLKAHTAADELYVEVGDGSSDHSCWQRPEDMTTPRTSYKIDASHPGSDVAGETAAAMAAAWLHRATGDQSYLDFIAGFNNNGGVRSMFSWDDKFVGAQVLISKLILEKKVANSGNWIQYKNNAEQFICSVLQKGGNNVKISPGGILWFQPWNNLQYTTAAMLVLAAHADHLSSAKSSLQCPSGGVSPNEIIAFVGRQVDYILGNNPKKMSYMVGFGQKWPTKVHHRGSSIISVRKDSTPVDCKGGFDKWFYSPNPNPNVIEGAIVGGPDAGDGYSDDRGNYQQAEPATVTTAAIVGVLARLT
ncbi:Endoglucanase 12 [Platanthera guangdongensis]|uniref:cellulase n=1 Tax=Platanthera guangdongensis TaxID=2320717 RepID=A0ABR2MFC3_9ASPA